MRNTLLFVLCLAWQCIDAQTNVNVQVDASAGKLPISPYIYGKNGNVSDEPSNPTTAAEFQFVRDAGLHFTRENGGNNATKYNWRLKLTSHPDWYNNVYAHDWDYAAKTLQDSLPGVQGMWAFQLIGEAASNTNNNFNDWAYNQSQWWSGTGQNLAGGGTPNTAGGGKALIEGDTTKYLEPWTADSTVGILKHWFGTGGLGYNQNSILYWSMDNEVEIWNGTHDDVMPTQLSAEAFMQRYFAVAKKARALFPNIKLCGPVPCGEWFWYTWNGGRVSYQGNTYNWLEYFIKRCADEEKATGIRLVDVIDIHNYPGETNDSDIVQLHRVYFDTTYVYPGANGVKTTTGGWDNTITKEYILGRCNAWLTKYMGANNGVQMGVSELGFNYTSASVSSVCYASMLGTMADNSVCYFTPWSWNIGMWEAVHLFSRYAKSTRVQSTSSNEHYVTAYSSISTYADSMTVILVNRSLSVTKNITLTLANFAVPNGSYKTLQLANLPTTETFVSHTNNALKQGTATVTNKTVTISLPPLSSTAIILTAPLQQTITLQKGWNFISTNVYPSDSSIATLFASLNVQEIKTASAFWEKGQNTAFNSLKAIVAGNGYLVKMNATGTLQVAGTPMSTANYPNPSLKTGWNMVGCPFQTTTALSGLFNNTNSKMVKDFDGFWISGGSSNSIQNLTPGKGYFMKK